MLFSHKILFIENSCKCLQAAQEALKAACGPWAIVCPPLTYGNTNTILSLKLETNKNTAFVTVYNTQAVIIHEDVLLRCKHIHGASINMLY